MSIAPVPFNRFATGIRKTKLRRRPVSRAAVATAAAVTLLMSGCSDGSTDTVTTATAGSEASPTAGSEASPTVLATTGIWSDIVSNVACGGLADVETVIPIGGDPHSYEPSLQDRARMDGAALVVANGLELEERLEDTLDAVEEAGTPVYRAAEQIDTIPFSAGSGGHHGEDDDHGEEADDDHGDDADDDHGEEADDDHGEEAGDDHGEEAEEDHGDEAGEDDHGEEAEEDHGDEADDDDHGEEAEEDHGDEAGDDEHGHGAAGDPHVWFDPLRISATLPELVRLLVDDVGLDADAVESCVSTYQAELAELDAEISGLLDQVPVENRKLVTNHDALGYFADRYGFEIIGTVIPAPSTGAETNPAQLEELAQVIEHEGVPAIFAETQHTTADIDALARRVGSVEVVTLYTGSLGPPGSGAEDYIGFMRTNAQLISDALA